MIKNFGHSQIEFIIIKNKIKNFQRIIKKTNYENTNN